MMNDRIGIIVVLYCAPPPAFLTQLQDYNIVVVDNTPDRNLALSCGNLAYIPLMSNKGIATAQNIGINYLIQRGVDYMIFFDQDSNVSAAYINDIVREYKLVSQEVKNLFLLGPKIYNEKNGEEYTSIFHKYTSDNNNFERHREIISSGSCASVERIQAVGPLMDELFIDAVDSEWCWRASSKGYVSGITGNVQLFHNIGQKSLHIGKYIILVSAPIRYYYQYRNYLWLCRKSYVPWSWKRNVGIKYIIRLFYSPFILKKGWTILKYMIKGIYAGLFTSLTIK